MASSSSNSLHSVKSLAATPRTQVYRDSIGTSNSSDLFSFKLLRSSQVQLSLKALKANANIQLIRDKNNNKRIDRGEVLRVSQLSGKRAESINASLSAGIYHIRVYGNNAKTTYQLGVSATPIGQFQAEYYRGRNLSGKPTFTRFERQINYNWGTGKPSSRLDTDNFSVRWSGVFDFRKGNHLFQSSTDDGIRVWVDNKLVINGWRDQALTEYGSYQFLSAGKHKVTVEYYENSGDAIAKVFWQKATPWRAEYFRGTNLAGSPIATESLGDKSYTFLRNWQLGSPRNVPSDLFSAKVTSQRFLPAGLYQIKTQADDGVRVNIGGQTVVDQWIAQPFSVSSGYFRSTGKVYPIEVQYYENLGGAALDFKIVPATRFEEPANEVLNWKSSVFVWDRNQGNAPPVNFHENTSNQIGVIDLGSRNRGDGKQGISLDWGIGAPKGYGDRLPHDLFAIRSYTWADFDGSAYKFRVRGDDGFQLLAKKHGSNEWHYITPQNQWSQAYGDHQEITYSLPAGRYDLHFHMFENGGHANFDFSWEKAVVWDKPLQNNTYSVTSGFGLRGSEFHTGIDLGTRTSTPPVEAARTGIVTFARGGWNAGYGNLVKIDHGNGIETRYAHLSTIAVKEGDIVGVDTVIGNVGNTGRSTGNHLHFEVRVNGQPQNPADFFVF